MRRRLTITGRVQGVFYRKWFVDQAQDLGVAGWVRNRDDGSVEALVDGSVAAVDAIVARAHHGPPAARVTRVAVADDDSADPLTRFEQRATL